MPASKRPAKTNVLRSFVVDLQVSGLFPAGRGPNWVTPCRRWRRCARAVGRFNSFRCRSLPALLGWGSVWEGPESNSSHKHDMLRQSWIPGHRPFFSPSIVLGRLLGRLAHDLDIGRSYDAVLRGSCCLDGPWSSAPRTQRRRTKRTAGRNNAGDFVDHPGLAYDVAATGMGDERKPRTENREPQPVPGLMPTTHDWTSKSSCPILPISFTRHVPKMILEATWTMGRCLFLPR